MKKLISFVLLFATILTFTACGGDDDEPQNNISKDQLIGLWDATAVQFDNDGKWIDITSRPDLALSIRFYNDGTYYGKGALGDGEGTYSLNGNTIKTYIDGALYCTYVIKSLVGDKAELTLTMDGESFEIRAKKSKLSLSPSDPSIIITTTVGGSTYHGRWISEVLDGSHFVSQSMEFDEFGWLTWHIDDYTIDNNGLYAIYINGEKVKATKNSETIKHLTYSYDGRTLVTRDDIIIYTSQGKILPSYEERVYTAIIDGDHLTISDGAKTTVYTKKIPIIS